MICFSYSNTYNLTIVLVRPANNCGTHQYPEKFIPITVRRVLRGEAAVIYDTGEDKRDWLFIRDCCEAIDLVLRRGKIGEIYIIEAQEQHTNNQIVKLIFKILNKNEKIIYRFGARPGHDKAYAVHCEKIIKLRNP